MGPARSSPRCSRGAFNDFAERRLSAVLSASRYPSSGSARRGGGDITAPRSLDWSGGKSRSAAVPLPNDAPPPVPPRQRLGDPPGRPPSLNFSPLGREHILTFAPG